MLEFNLKQLEVFVATAEYNSFTRAAEALYLTQSTVSTHIQGLERALGIVLFQRSAKKKITLTEAGKEAYLAARDILSQCEKLQSRPSGAEPPTLAIGASTVPAQCILPDLISAYARESPNCRFLLKRGDSARVHKLLQAGEIQVGFVGAVLDETLFHYSPIQKDRLVLVTQNAPRFRQLPSVATQELLLQEPFLAREENSGTWKATVEWLRQKELSPERLRVLARMENPEAIRRAVAQGMGISIQSSLMVTEDVEAGRLLWFDLEQGGVWRTLYLTLLQDAPPHTERSAFVKFALRDKSRVY